MTAPTLALLLALLPQDPPAAAPATPPPAIEWQRTLADALAIQKVTNQPLLLCVNMDGEVFCERFATETYREPAFVAATQGYVCLIASPDRHNAFDLDWQGNRIECPRFPGVTCGEHIAVEPLLFEKFFGGRRNAPRHLCVSPAGEKLCDHIMENSMQPAIASVKQHAGAAAPALPAATEALLRLRRAAARRVVEERYRQADEAGRLALLQVAQGGQAPFDLLRMPLRGPAGPLFDAAVQALCATATPDAAFDLLDALPRADEPALQELLVAALERVGQEHPPTAALHGRLLAARRGIAEGTHNPDPAVLRESAAPATPLSREELEAAVEAAEKNAKAAPSPRAWLALAQATLALADFLAEANDKYAAMTFEDSARAAAKAEADADAGLAPALAAVQTCARWQQGDAAATAALALQMHAALAALGPAARIDGALLARALRAEAQANAALVTAAIEKEADADVTGPTMAAVAANAALCGSPLATEADRLRHAGMLEWAQARREALAVLNAAVQAHPASAAVHERFRNRVVADLGADALLPRYMAIVAACDDKATAQWFAGYAAIVAAEQHVRDRRPGEARAAYDACVTQFEAAAGHEAYADSARHFAVLALAGRALLRHQERDAAGAVQDLRRARELRPASMGESDGLGRKPDALLRRVARELAEQGQAELAAQLGNG